MTLNKSKLRKEFSAEYVMTEKAKETLQWIEEHCEGWMEEVQSKNDMPYWVIENRFFGTEIYYLNIDSIIWNTNIHNATKFYTIELARESLKKAYSGRLSQHLDISEPKQPEQSIEDVKIPVGKSLGKFKLEPMQDGKSAEEWRTKLLDYLHKFYTRFEEWSNDYTDKDSFLQMIDSFIKNNPLHEYRSQAIRLPEREESFHWLAQESFGIRDYSGMEKGFDYAISELKRLNNI